MFNDSQNLYFIQQLFFVRSLAACELLINAGYQSIFWVQGGLESAEDEVISQLLQFSVLYFFLVKFRVRIRKSTWMTNSLIMSIIMK